MSLISDFKFALRRLRQRPLASAAAIATIVVGLAAATTLFTFVDGVLLRPLPFRDAKRLVAIWETVPEWKKNPVLAAKWDRTPVSIPQYRAVRSAGTVFDDVAIWAEESLPLVVGGHVDYVRVTKASWTIFHVLGISPVAGRLFAPNDDVPNAQRVALVSEETWRTRYGSSRDIIGRTVNLEQGSFVIIGILPHGLTLDPQRDAVSGSYGGTVFSEFWIPAGLDSTEFEDATRQNFEMLGRLKLGASISSAEQVVQNAIHQTAEDRASRGVRVVPWQHDQTRGARGPLLILFAASCFLLLIACANVALLSLSEAAARQRELAMRVALGARRAVLIRQFIAESIALCSVGAVFAFPLASLGLRLLVAAAPIELSAITALHLDLRVLAFGIGAILFSSLISGCIPALAASRIQAATVIAGGGERTTSRGYVLPQLITGFQVALAIVVLIGAALLYRTSQRIAQVPPGFDDHNLLVVEPIIPTDMWADSARLRVTYADLFANLSALPGVVGVTGISEAPIIGVLSNTRVTLNGQQPASQHPAQFRAIVPSYFSTMRIRRRAGREFTIDDKRGSELVAIVSAALAKRDFADVSPLDERVKVLGAWRRIVGVVDDIHFATLSQDLEPTIYLPFAQSGSWQLSVLIRTQTNPATIAESVRETIRRAAPGIGIRRVEVMSSALRRTFAGERYRSVLMTLFGLIATLLAAIGTYGVAARSVRNKRREAAIRLAVGASTASIARLLMRVTATGLAGGCVVGLLIAPLVERQLRPYLFQIEPTDPSVYATVLIAILLLSLGTTWLAVRGVTRVDPVTVLRGD
ncbi:MAG TPA: ABC transporter permease [Gemmatimonadaceae bacterium]|nr:ABC transporter permease [Gemmatimonadaceae bacterium]